VKTFPTFRIYTKCREIGKAGRGVTSGGQGGHNSLYAESLWGAEYCGFLKSPNTVASSFFNTVHLLAKDLRFENGGAILASCQGVHPILLRP